MQKNSDIFLPNSEHHSITLAPNNPEDDKSPLISQNDRVPYLITLEELVNIVQEGEKRTFSEEIDKLEAYGGIIYNITL